MTDKRPYIEVKHKLYRRNVNIRFWPRIGSTVESNKVAHADGEQDKECNGKWKIVRRADVPTGYWLECRVCKAYAAEPTYCTCRYVYCQCGMGEDKTNGIHKQRYSMG